jgi:hypothetical protein
MAVAIPFVGLYAISTIETRHAVGWPLAALAYAVCAAWMVRRLLQMAATRSEEERAAGYTCRSGATGSWRLSPFLGTLRRAPDPTVPPAGYYPSPYFPGALQLWDGPDWAPLPRRWWRRDANFRRPPVDFLGCGNVGTASAPRQG